MAGPTIKASPPPITVPTAPASDTVERVHSNSSVMGLRKTPMVGLICAPDASDERNTTPTITHP